MVTLRLSTGEREILSARHAMQFVWRGPIVGRHQCVSGRNGRIVFNRESTDVGDAKSFAELSEAEREAMTEEEWDRVPPEQKRSCHDCRHLKAKVSWWCTLKEAIRWRGTRIPGGCLCPFWEPRDPTPTEEYFYRDGIWFGAIMGVWATLMVWGITWAFSR